MILAVQRERRRAASAAYTNLDLAVSVWHFCNRVGVSGRHCLAFCRRHPNPRVSDESLADAAVRAKPAAQLNTVPWRFVRHVSKHRFEQRLESLYAR